MSSSVAHRPFDLGAALLRARAASWKLAECNRSALLQQVADALLNAAQEILEANASDVEGARAAGVRDALIDRLALSRDRLAAMAAAVRQIAELPDPLGRVLDGWQHPYDMMPGSPADRN